MCRPHCQRPQERHKMLRPGAGSGVSHRQRGGGIAAAFHVPTEQSRAFHRGIFPHLKASRIERNDEEIPLPLVRRERAIDRLLVRPLGGLEMPAGLILVGGA